MITTMTAELSDAIEAAGPRVTASFVATLRLTGTPGEFETDARKVLADVIADWSYAEVGGPDDRLVDLVAARWQQTGDAFGGTKVGYLIRQCEEIIRQGRNYGTVMTRLRARAWNELAEAGLVCTAAGLLDTPA